MENSAVVAEEMQRWLADLEGFRGFIMLSREGSSVGLTFWESHEVAERHRGVRTEFVERITSVAGVEIEESVEYEMTYAHIAQSVADFTR
jgi:hypothetical protein